jgi:opacity protein-like surface antigen
MSMKKTAVILSVMLGIVLIASPGFAQLRGGGFLLAASYYIPVEEGISNGYGSTIGFVLPVRPRVQLALEWKYAQHSVTKQENGFLTGRLYVTPLLLSIRYSFADRVTVVPYVFGGLGWFFASFNADERQSIDEATVVKQDPKGGLGLYGGMGLNYRASPSLAIYAEALYLYRDTKVETVYLFDPPETFSVNLSSLSLQIGIRYFY